MSKTEGKKIGIKFNLPINELQVATKKYKYLRWLVKNGWGGRIYIYEIEIKENGIYYTPTGTITSSSALQPATNAFDSSYISSYWRPSTTINEWVQIEFNEPLEIEGFRWHTGTLSYKPKEFELLGSSDGTNWEVLISQTSPNVNGLLEFVSSSGAGLSGNEGAFIISGNEYEYVDGPNYNGPLVNKTYQVGLVSTHPIEANAILLEMADTFRSSVGNLIINYNHVEGNIVGESGVVESFEVIFLPEDLVKQSNPRVREYIEASVGGSIKMLYITKIQTYDTEYIQASVGGSINFIHIDDINP